MLVSPIYDELKDREIPGELSLHLAPGIDTFYKALYNRVKNFPNDDFYGVRVEKEYKWTNFKTAAQNAKWLAAGLMKLNLLPEVEAEG